MNKSYKARQDLIIENEELKELLYMDIRNKSYIYIGYMISVILGYLLGVLI